MIMIDYEYHIYSDGIPIYWCLSEEQFRYRWNQLNEANADKLSFEKLRNDCHGVKTDQLNEPSH